MSSDEIDSYLAGLDEPKRDTLERLRTSIMAVVPDADQCIAYGAPAFKVRGKAVAGFAAFKSHLSYLPIAVQCSTSSTTTLPDMRPRRARCDSASTTHSLTSWSNSSSPPTSESSARHSAAATMITPTAHRRGECPQTTRITRRNVSATAGSAFRTTVHLRRRGSSGVASDGAVV